MTRKEAEEYASGIDNYVRRKMAENNLPLDEDYLRDSHGFTVYEQLSGDCVPPSARRQDKLHFWSQKLHHFRSVAGTDEKTFIIEKLQEARRGE